MLIQIVMSLIVAMMSFATAKGQITIKVNGAEFQVKEAQNITISKDGIAVDGKQLTGDRPITVSIYGNVANLAVTGGNVTATRVNNLSVIDGEATVKEVTERVTAISSTISIEKNSGVITNTATQSGSGNVQYNKFWCMTLSKKIKTQACFKFLRLFSWYSLSSFMTTSSAEKFVAERVAELDVFS